MPSILGWPPTGSHTTWCFCGLPVSVCAQVLDSNLPRRVMDVP
jgi:hypothetical protein